MVKNATDVTTSVLDELNPIKADVEKIKGSYGSKQTTDFNKALTEANNSGGCSAGYLYCVWSTPASLYLMTLVNMVIVIICIWCEQGTIQTYRHKQLA